MIGELQPRSVLFITAQPPLILTHIILYRKCDLKKKKKRYSVTVSFLSTLKGQFLQQFQHVR